jgi:uncharacterized protein
MSDPSTRHPVVHLELHTADRDGARELYGALFGWRQERLGSGRGSYLAVELGGVGGGIVECAASRPVWIPYVAVDRLVDATECAVSLGATVLLEPREGAKGWRSVVSTVQGGEIAFWQPKRGSQR